MATIKDVARLSGVSTTTVSEVLNKGWRPVHAETRKRVLEAAQELDYRPNAMARGLVGKRMNTLGVVFTHWNTPQASPFVLGALLGVLTTCGARQQNTMIFNLDFWERGLEHLPEFCDGRCDGLLLMVPPDDCSLAGELVRRKMPCVVISGQDATGQAPCVDVDNTRAAFEMTNALLALGHRRIAYLGESFISETVSSFARERHEGYRQAMKAAGVYRPELDDLSGEAQAMTLLRSAQAPTAFFCLYDDLALRLLEQLRQHGVRVPDEVSVAGFDDIPYAALNRPTLSTVRQPINQIGERAAELLLSIIDGNIPITQRELLPTEIVLRASTSPPHSENV